MPADPAAPKIYYVLSDLHIFDREQDYLFNRDKEDVFARLCSLVLKEEAHLVLAGDVFDFTGMTPCRLGQRQFFEESVPKERWDESLVAISCHPRDTDELLKAVKAAFPSFFASLQELARNHRLIMIPGNHDCAFLTEAGKESFRRSLAVADNEIQWVTELAVDHFLIATHGNEFDPANSTAKGCHNPGFIFTSALYKGVMPALRMWGVPAKIVDAIPAVRPEEETLSSLRHYLGETELSRVLLAFARLLQRNGYFRGVGRLPAWFLSHHFPLISPILRAGITPERVRSLLPDDEKLKLQARAGAYALKKKLAKQRPELAESIIVLGHTHELDVQADYVNLGTWIDHISALVPEQLANPDRSLPVLRIESGKAAALYNMRGLKTGSLDDCARLDAKALNISF